MEAGTGEATTAGKSIRPLDAFERRVLGVLIEKAKTTPDQYPLSLNGVVTGCNQKSNRDPVMTVDEEQAARALEGLRKCGAAAEVFGSGKLPRYRHLAYEWLGVGKEELAIMGELLLRGEQTEGDLRGRASRMDPIPDLDTLRGHLDRLAERGLVIWLSPPGRGRMLTHGLLPDEKLEKVRRELGLAMAAAAQAAPAADVSVDDEPEVTKPAAVAERATTPPPAAAGPSPAEFERRIADLEHDVAALHARLKTLEDALGG
ncbi:MAG: DUF480 domain-containing protein [Planctomycetes bacterium]|nr:DUF480 domain-containing protein [Planctomycetota bacterium]